MTRLSRTSEAIGMFLKSLGGTMKGGQVGADSNRPIPDSVLNLKIRVGMRNVLQSRMLLGEGRGLQLDTKATYELKMAAYDAKQVTNDEARFLMTLANDASNFESDAKGELTKEGKLARFDLIRFAHAHLADIDPAVLKLTGKTEVEAAAARGSNAEVMKEWRDGTIAQFFKSGEAKETHVQAARKNAVGVTATASVTALPVEASAKQVLETFLRQTDEIGGWNWMDKEINSKEPFPVMIKPGINWGISGYPSVTSWEGVYASALGTLERAAAKGHHNLEVTVADESGIENKDFGRTTMMNMEDTAIFGASVFAGVENAYRRQGMNDAAAHKAALDHIAKAMRARDAKYPDTVPNNDKKSIPADPKIEDLVHLVKHSDTELIAMAKSGGVEIKALDEGPTTILKPVLKRRGQKLKSGEVPMSRKQLDAMKHFKDGIRVNAEVLKFKKMINLPKPPGRHGIMGNCGLTGANKNHIGLLAGVDRGTVLHNRFARVPQPREGENYGTFTERIEQAVRWMGDGAVNLKELKREGRLTEDKMGDFNWEAHYDDMVSTGEEWITHLNGEAQKLADQGGGEQAGGPGQQFFDKLGELEMFFQPMTAFTWTDMRQTVASLGPDFGEAIDVGISIASDNSSVVDAYATAALKQVYDERGQQTEEYKNLPAQFKELENLDDAGAITKFRKLMFARIRKATGELYESAQAKRFLTTGRPERLKSWVGAMKMGLAPTDIGKVVLKSGHDLVNQDYLGEQTPGPRN